MTEFVPLVDYLFRYDRGAFWVGKYSFQYFITPFNRVTRFILNPLLHTRTLYRALHHSGLVDYYMVQDVGVPCDKVSEFADWLHDGLQIYPLWLCPLRLTRDTPNARHGLHSEFADLKPGSEASTAMNFGIWGPISSNVRSLDRDECVRQNRLLEEKVLALGGKKWLYSQAYYTEDEFWAHYDRGSYDDVRAKYGADWMPSVYDKVKGDVETQDRHLFWSIWPVRGLYSLLMTVLGGDYLLKAAS